MPYWGCSALPGSTYYLQKLNHDIFGIVNHGSKLSTVYLFDEQVGPKNTDHTPSYLTHFASKVLIVSISFWITLLVHFMMGWAYEIVQQNWLNYIRFSFLIAGHVKFSPDLLFS